MGGDCAVGGVTIKPPYYKDWNPAPIIDTIDWYLNNQRLFTKYCDPTPVETLTRSM
mgnify:CR=1 FL=1